MRCVNYRTRSRVAVSPTLMHTKYAFASAVNKKVSCGARRRASWSVDTESDAQESPPGVQRFRAASTDPDNIRDVLFRWANKR
jgi:hypothetical protein